MFITGPFRACPQCGHPQLGTLSVTGNVHARRCRNCFYDQKEQLPPLAKKLIYLDQMVLSGMAKEIDPVRREKTRRSDAFWLKAFDQIDRLVELQLIVCPNSPIHEVESSYDDRYESVRKRLYKHLASGVSLRSPHEVRMAQLAEAFDAWLEDRDPDWGRITREDVIRGELDRWSDRLLVTANLGHLPGEIERRRKSRDRTHEAWRQLWERWAAEDEMSIEDFFQRERRGVADAALQCFRAHIERWHGVTTGAEVVEDPTQLMPGWPVQLVSWVLRRLEEEGVPEDGRLQDAACFLYSDQALCAPENHLGALLHASLAWRARSGQKCPDRGTPNDIAFIAAYLPYCDAMYIDNPFAQLLSEGRLAAAAKDHPTKIFSKRSQNSFLEYLYELEADAEPAHLDLVVQTYGETWTQPYRSMLEHERSK
ncbi:hypothetical protein [Candidatus Palauibacter sp.]|uniref:hypothetical protein n=1 Tax=Candidatus Palauibacter sp. TaxID=3101350 RepID=UPI003B5A26F7